jgi:hypothetical protein
MENKMKTAQAYPEGSPQEEAGEKPEFEKHEIEHMANTLMDAEEIKSNPKKMKHVRPHLAKKAKAIRSIADLRQRAAMLPPLTNSSDS